MNDENKNMRSLSSEIKEESLDTPNGRDIPLNEDETSASKSELLNMIRRRDSEIKDLIKRAERAERLLEKANGYNEDLKAKITSLSSELHEYRSSKKLGKSVLLQVSENDLNEANCEKPMPTWGPAVPGDESSLSIAESLKAVAEEVIQDQDMEENQKNCSEQLADPSSDYVYDVQTGFYYHPESGYYWDPASSLFYDYTSGTYYQYDEATGDYTVHSQVDITARDKCQIIWPSSSSGVDSLSSQFSVLNISTQRYQKNALEVAEHHPPCIRLIVQESDHLKMGSLFIITCTGGTIGREPNTGHAIEIPDLNVSKLHAQVDYDYDSNGYFITDKGSQNGTLLNKKKLSQSKEKSAAYPLNHDDTLEIGGTSLLLHIHSGHDTCEDCEPGQVQAKLKALNPVKNDLVILSKKQRHRQRLQELKQIKKKYGLQNSHFENTGAALSNSDYCDKAYLRRKYIGSEPAESHSTTKEIPASVQNPISASNKGHKLLSKMGWKEGEGLGKTNSGIAAPVCVELRVNQNAGLGSSSSYSLSLDNVHNAKKAQRWSTARQMYSKLEAQEKQSNKKPLDLNTIASEAMQEFNSSKYKGRLHAADEPPSSSTLYSDHVDLNSISSQVEYSQPSTPVMPSGTSLKKYSSVPKISWVKGTTQNPPPVAEDTLESQGAKIS